MDEKVQSDKQTTIFAVCDEMLREGLKVDKIKARQVAQRVSWSHTTVTPYVKAWQEQRAKKEREAIQQTQMSPNFVKALHAEVEDRIARLRTVDAEQYDLLSNELSDLIETNNELESQLKSTQEKLSSKTEDASQQRSLVIQYQKDLATMTESQKSEVKQLNERYEKDTTELKKTIIENQAKFDSEKSELKEEHKEEVRKLSEKKDELHVELQSKTAALAEAAVKTENYTKLSVELESSKSQNTKLLEENLRFKAELSSKTEALAAAGKSVDDNIRQRDKAQSAASEAESELKAMNRKYNKLLALALAQGVKMDDIESKLK